MQLRTSVHINTTCVRRRCVVFLIVACHSYKRVAASKMQVINCLHKNQIWGQRKPAQ